MIGAGPVGLEAARTAAAAGLDVQVYEAAGVGAGLARFGDVPLFTPFAMNSTETTRARLRQEGATLPGDEALVSAAELVARYLEPIASLPELRGRIHERARVIAIARDDPRTPASPALRDELGRAARPFLLSVEERGATRFERADHVVDASGITGQPLATGPGGLQAEGEPSLGDRVDRHLLPSLESFRARYGGARVLLIGTGHSAATALVALGALARAGYGAMRVVWVHRDRNGGAVFPAPADDPLPARAGLEREANQIAAGSPWLDRRPGAAVLAYEVGTSGIGVRLRLRDGAEDRVTVDRVLALVGYRPDRDLFRELHVHLCYASEGPMAHAAALLAAQSNDSSRAGDCLAQTTHGAESLRTTEPGFFLLGSKSYGRSPGFLLRNGYEQVREWASLAVPGFTVSEALRAG